MESYNKKEFGGQIKFCKPKKMDNITCKRLNANESWVGVKEKTQVEK